ncbi:MAG: RDD family protein [Gammaproteobacteria bacterium]
MKDLSYPTYAGFWRRVGAALVDSFIFSLLFGLVLGPAFVNASLFTLEGLSRSVLTMLFTVGFWINFVGTPGKLLLGCQVVDADSFEVMNARQAFIRFVAYLASMLPLMLGFLWIAKDARKQGFHDKIANTVVLYNANVEADDESRKSLNQLMGEAR